jgi:uncharacterized protein YuzE
MKNIIYTLIFLTNLTFGQTVKLTEPEIEKYSKSIDKMKIENKLVKISYQNMSSCGGEVDGYYLNNKLILIESRYNAELGFSSKTFYIDNEKFLKVIYREYFAEWGKYDQNYPADKFEYDSTKMTYTDTIYSITLTNSIVFNKKVAHKIISNKLNQSLLDRLISCGQEMKHELQEVTKQVDSLKFIKEMPYDCEDNYNINERHPWTIGCGDELYWNVVRLSDNAIELLIDKLNDTTTTEAIVRRFGYYYTTADIAYTALKEIIHKIPTFELLEIEIDKEGCGYCSFWQHLNKSYENREKFKSSVKQWYHNNKDNFIWVENDSFETCLCYGKHPNGGHYELKSAK